MQQYTKYTAEIDTEQTTYIGSSIFTDIGTLYVTFEHRGGIFHSGGIHPDDQPHEFNIKNAVVKWSDGTTGDAYHFLSVEEVLKQNQDTWDTV